MKKRAASVAAAPAPRPLAELRREVAAKRAASREAEWQAKIALAMAEQRVIAAVADGDPKRLGANKEDRERELLILVNVDAAYTFARSQHLAILTELEWLTAEVEIARDARKDREIESLGRLTDALSAYSGLTSIVLDGRGRADG